MAFTKTRYNGIFSAVLKRFFSRVFEFFEVHLSQKNLHFRRKIVRTSEKTPQSGKISCFQVLRVRFSYQTR